MNSLLNYTVIFPNDLLDSVVYDKVSINSIIWKVSPFQINSHEDYQSVSSFVSLFLTNENMEVIPVDSQIIFLQYPVPIYEPSIQESLECRSYDMNLTSNTINNANWEVFTSEIDPSNSCLSWEKMQTVTIETTHLSSFTLVHKSPQQLPLK